ncbi:hypothetical protein [Thalassobaculum sp.]|uniref:hypothetical protein n=1 Tax=Thalassobaculum sp. TaxID=2022740 RepID=UPI003B5B5E28
MTISVPLTEAEVSVYAAMVSAHWTRTARNPTDAECQIMAEAAREFVQLGAKFQ